MIHPEPSIEVGGDGGGNMDTDASDLPADFPMRDLLIENKLATIVSVKFFGDLTEIKGIGPATATEIANALLDLE